MTNRSVETQLDHGVQPTAFLSNFDQTRTTKNSSKFSGAEKNVILLMPDHKERQSIQDFLGYEGQKVIAFDKIYLFENWHFKNDFQIIIIEVDSTNDPNLIWLRNNKSLRSKGIIVISSQHDPLLRLVARKAGADDYLLKPVLHDELSTIIDNLKFRMRSNDSNQWVINNKEWVLIAPNKTVIKLNFSEKIILERLGAQPGQVVSKDHIAEALGHSPSVYDFRRLEIIIRRLRNKVIAQAGTRLPLDTAHRKGYTFISDVSLVD